MAGRIVDEDIEELRRRADLVEVVSHHLQLRKAGRVFRGLCPFHQEKTPSFTVDPDRRLYHCFGCGAGGDVFTFIRQVEGLSFAEAAERLADRFGLALRYEGGPARGEPGSRRALAEANAAAAAFYADHLFRAPEAAAARRYLEGRGFSPDDSRAWRLGYAPAGRDLLYRHLLARKFTSKQIVDAGLVAVSESGEHRDRFRGRLIFPIADLTGDVVGFGARVLGDEQPKYLNSPETPLYRKGKILYGLERAKGEAVRRGLAVVTEGYTDVIALHKIGVRNAVATCGTALGEDHFALLKRFCDRVVLAFDADTAGSVASERGFGLHAEAGLEVLVAAMPAGKDPADVALTEGGDAFELILGQAVPLMRFVLEAEVGRHRLDTAEGKAAAVRAAAERLAWEPREVVRAQHAFWLARRVGVDEQVVEHVMRELARARSGRRAPQAPVAVRRPGHVRLEREALGLLLRDPEERPDVPGWLREEHFTDPRHRSIFRGMAGAGPERGTAGVIDRLPDDETRRLAAELAFSPPVARDASEVFLRLEALRLGRQIEDLRSTLNRLDAHADAAGYDELFQELMRLEERRRALDQR